MLVECRLPRWPLGKRQTIEFLAGCQKFSRHVVNTLTFGTQRGVRMSDAFRFFAAATERDVSFLHAGHSIKEAARRTTGGRKWRRRVSQMRRLRKIIGSGEALSLFGHDRLEHSGKLCLPLMKAILGGRKSSSRADRYTELT
jgi:hypothetical protein